MGRELRAAIAAGAPVYLDALDEAALWEPAVFRVLEYHLGAAEAALVPWRLACRPAAWSQPLAAVLQSSLREFEELKLLPLSRSAAANLVSGAVADPDRFLRDLAAAGLGRLAGSPLRLRSAARQWAKTGELPGSQLEAVSFEITELLTETSGGRGIPAVSADRRRRLAARLAAMTVFGRAGRFTQSADPPPGALRIADLPSEPEPDQPGTLVNSAEYGEVLGTALFAAAADGGVSFGHQQYAEYLAAEYLASRRITRQQLPALLGAQADGRLPGPLTGVAAWLGALRPELVDDLAAANAAELAKAGVQLPSGQLREVVVGGVLKRAAAGDLDVAWGLDLSPLVHAGLEDQLAQLLDDGLAAPEELWWIARLAIAGECRLLAKALGQQAGNAAWRSWARRAAVQAVAALGDDEDIRRLAVLAHLDPAADPDDDVLAAVIEALYPRFLDIPGLLEVLRPQRNTGYLGGYYFLLGELSGQVPAGDLPAVLDWAWTQVRHGEGAYGDMLAQLVRRGWDHAQASATRAALARLIAALAEDLAWPHWPGWDDPPWTGRSPGTRRQLAAGVAEHVSAGQSYELIDLGLIGPGDLGWLLRELPALPSGAQDALASCVPLLARAPTAAEADLILGMPPSHPAYDFTTSLRQTDRIDSQAAWHYRRQRQRAADAESLQSASRADRSEQLAAALDDARADPGRWWRVALWLAAGGIGDNGEAVFTHDLTTRLGWSLLDQRERREVLDIGVRYLSAHRLEPAEWMGRPSISGDQVLADWSGVYLLTTLADHDPGRLAVLPAEVWRAWAPAVVGAWNSGGEAGDRARCLVTDLVPPAEKQVIADAALRQLDALQEHGGRLAPRRLYEHLSPSLAPPGR